MKKLRLFINFRTGDYTQVLLRYGVLILALFIAPLGGDPLENIRNTNSIRYVIKNGVVYEGDTLTEIWPHYRARSWLEGWYTDPKE